jgi:hypothetical protein
MNTQPDYIAYLAQLRKRQAEAAQEQALANVFGGLGEFAAARSGGGGGGSQSKQVEVPTGDLTIGQFGDFAKRKAGLEAEAGELARIDRIVADPRMKGISKDQLLSMRANNKDAYAKFLQDWVSGETETHFDPVTHDILSRPKYGPADRPYERIANVPGREQAAATLAKTQGEIAKAAAETEKITGVDTEKAREDIAKSKLDQIKTQSETGKIDVEKAVKELELLDPKALKSPENLARLETLSGIPASTLATMDPKSIVSETGKIITAREQSRAGEQTKIAGARIETSQKNIDKASVNISERAMRRDLLDKGEMPTGYPGADFEGKWKSFMSGGTNEGEARMRAYLSLSASDILRAGEGMKGSFSENDLKFLQEARAGSRTLSQSEMKRLLALQDLTDMRSLNEGIKERGKARKAVGQEDLDADDDRAGPLQTHHLQVIQAPLVRAAILTEGGRQYLKKVYGEDVANEAVARGYDIAAAKLPPDVFESYRTLPLQKLKADVDNLEKGDIAGAKDAAEKDNTAGALRLIIALREKAGEK